MKTKLSETLIQYGITQKDFAIKVGLSYPTIVNYCTGKTDIPKKQACKILNTLDNIKINRKILLENTLTMSDLLINNIIDCTKEILK